MPNEAHEYVTAIDSREPTEYIVAFLDVLGFRSRVRSYALAQLVEDYRKLLRDIEWNQSFPIFRLPAGGVEHWTTRVIVLSDSILLWSLIKPEAIKALLTSSSRILGHAAEIGWPLRGVVTAGECVFDEANGVFIGEALVRAVELEKEQEWVGCGIDARALDHEAAGATIRKHVDVVAYNVPMKAGASPITAALWWKTYAPDAEERLNEMAAVTSHTNAGKYEAAIRFINGSPCPVSDSSQGV